VPICAKALSVVARNRFAPPGGVNEFLPCVNFWKLLDSGVRFAINRVLTALQEAIRGQLAHYYITAFCMVHGRLDRKAVMQTMKQGRKGFTLVEIMIVVAIIGLLAAIAIPNLQRSRTTSTTNLCIDNLRMLDAAKQQWALERGAVSTSVPQGSDIQPYLGRGNGELPVCPLDTQASFPTSYNLNNCQTQPQCLIVSSVHVLP
jgi:prepilin-type N-terminal cleavage/methylation domain-containing protein